MKIRKSFVTNSSSSSFICDICGKIESGYDLSYADANMICCDEGHEFCDHHESIDFEKEITKEFVLKYIKRVLSERDPTSNYSAKLQELLNEVCNPDKEFNFEEWVEEFEFDYELPKELCPICNHEYVTDKELFEYIFSKTKSKEQWTEECRKELRGE